MNWTGYVYHEGFTQMEPSPRWLFYEDKALGFIYTYHKGVIRIQPLGTMNVCTNCWDNPLSRYWDISLDNWKIWPAGGAGCQGIIKLRMIHPLGTTEVCTECHGYLSKSYFFLDNMWTDWPTDRHPHPKSHAAIRITIRRNRKNNINFILQY